jgi:predicted DNA-binding transcriptional regulator YafY
MSAFDRYKAIEEILVSQNGQFITRNNLKTKLNNYLYSDGLPEISINQLDKDIKYLKDKKAPLISHPKKGYAYKAGSVTLLTANAIKRSKKEEEELSFALENLASKAADFPLLLSGLETINRLVGKAILENKELPVMAENSTGTVAGTEFISELYGNIKFKKPVRIEYRKRGEEKNKFYNISPYLLKEHRGFWYLIGFNHDADATKAPVIVLALHRMKKITNANVSFHESKAFNSKEYFKFSLGVFHDFKNEPIEVKFWASETASDFLNLKKIHASQRKLQPMNIGNRAGQVYQIKVYDSEELLHLFLSRAENFRVLEPLKLVQNIKHKLKEMQNLYS